MKFIKTENGNYLNVELVREFFIVKDERNGDGYVACAQMRDFAAGYCKLQTFACDPKSTTQFDPKEAAQAWLDDFVAKLNEED